MNFLGWRQPEPLCQTERNLSTRLRGRRDETASAQCTLMHTRWRGLSVVIRRYQMHETLDRQRRASLPYWWFPPSHPPSLPWVWLYFRGRLRAASFFARPGYRLVKRGAPTRLRREYDGLQQRGEAHER